MSMRPLALLALCALLPAQSVVVPNANATNSSTGVLNNPLRELNMPRTYMMGINAAELAGIPPGSLINGVSMRAGHTTSNPALWPAADVVWNDYEVTVGNVLPTNTWSLTFANNWVGTPVQVRSGRMVVPAGTYENIVPAPTANPWGEFYWDFQVPFQYFGGDLGILFTHPGSTATTSIFLEQVAANSAAHGQAMVFATAFRAPTASSQNYVFCVLRVHYGYGNPAGCPGTGGMAPNLVQSGDVTGGGTILLTVANAPPHVAALQVFGFGSIAVPLPNGCDLLTPPVSTLLTLLDHNGMGRVAITVPPGITGSFNAQAFVLDSGAPGGFTATNGVEPAAR